jgi:PPM family protein phosphatase
MIVNQLHLEVGTKSETGYVRTENQDRMSWTSIPLGQLYIVADGMGRHAGGAKAATLTTDYLTKSLREFSKNSPADTAIRHPFEKTNQDVYQQAHAGDPANEGMGSTAIMMLVNGQSARIAHVGDSRVYLYRKGKLQLLTKDHTQVQQMVDASMLTLEQARVHPSASILDRAIGNRPSVEVSIISELRLINGDSILLCSDGLSGYADDREIALQLDDALSPQENVDRLISLALEKGGEDNVTIQFIRIGKAKEVPRRTLLHSLKLLVVFFILTILGSSTFITYRLFAKSNEDNDQFFQALLAKPAIWLGSGKQKIGEISPVKFKKQPDVNASNGVSQYSHEKLAHTSNLSRAKDADISEGKQTNTDLQKQMAALANEKAIAIVRAKKAESLLKNQEKQIATLKKNSRPLKTV